MSASAALLRPVISPNRSEYLLESSRGSRVVDDISLILNPDSQNVKANEIIHGLFKKLESLRKCETCLNKGVDGRARQVQNSSNFLR